jgi:aromatic ring-opening dioxygenase catalytic subunit (LigB family)
MLEAIKSALKAGGVEHKTEKRGLDHGVWGKHIFPTIRLVAPSLITQCRSK